MILKHPISIIVFSALLWAVAITHLVYSASVVITGEDLQATGVVTAVLPLYLLAAGIGIWTRQRWGVVLCAVFFVRVTYQLASQKHGLPIVEHIIIVFLVAMGFVLSIQRLWRDTASDGRRETGEKQGEGPAER